MSRIGRIAGSAFGRIVAGYLLVAVVLAGAWIWSLYGPLTNAVVAQQERNIQAVARSAAILLESSNQSPEQVAKNTVEGTDLRLTVVDSDGTVLGDSNFDPSRMENHRKRPEIAAALEGRTGADRRVSATEGDEQVYVAVPGSFQGKPVAVRVAQSLADVKAIAANLRRFGLLVLSLALLVSVAIAWRLTSSAARPVLQLSEAAQNMAAGNLSERIPRVPSDLEALAEALESLKGQMRSRIEALEAERGTLRATLDGLEDAVLVFDGGLIQLANRSADRLLAAPPRGWEDAELRDLSVSASLKAALAGELTSPTSSGIEVGPDPTGRSWRVLVAPLQASGQQGRSIAVVSDITDRARLDRVRREFVANASHELKTPVAGIGLLAQSAAMAASDGDDAQAVEFARQIADETARLQRLVTDLLDLSRIESTPAPGTVTDVRAAVANLLVSHRAAAASKNLGLSADLSAIDGRDVFVTADPTDVAVALDNLVDNAINYTDEGSIEVAVRAEGSIVTISVTDTGPGIAAEHLSRIFERFYRVDRARSRQGGGTGLGLALVRHVAERNGGTVSVASDEGAGSRFELRLPLAG